MFQRASRDRSTPTKATGRFAGIVAGLLAPLPFIGRRFRKGGAPASAADAPVDIDARRAEWAARRGSRPHSSSAAYPELKPGEGAPRIRPAVEGELPEEIDFQVVDGPPILPPRKAARTGQGAALPENGTPRTLQAIEAAVDAKMDELLEPPSRKKAPSRPSGVTIVTRSSLPPLRPSVGLPAIPFPSAVYTPAIPFQAVGEQEAESPRAAEPAAQQGAEPELITAPIPLIDLSEELALADDLLDPSAPPLDLLPSLEVRDSVEMQAVTIAPAPDVEESGPVVEAFEPAAVTPDVEALEPAVATPEVEALEPAAVALDPVVEAPEPVVVEAEPVVEVLEPSVMEAEPPAPEPPPKRATRPLTAAELEAAMSLVPMD